MPAQVRGKGDGSRLSLPHEKELLIFKENLKQTKATAHTGLYIERRVVVG
jgi:hypothetical protein